MRALSPNLLHLLTLEMRLPQRRGVGGFSQRNQAGQLPKPDPHSHSRKHSGRNSTLPDQTSAKHRQGGTLLRRAQGLRPRVTGRG